MVSSSRSTLLTSQAGHAASVSEQEPRSRRVSSHSESVRSVFFRVSGAAALPPVRPLPQRAGRARDEADAGGGKPQGALRHNHGAFPCQVEKRTNISNPLKDL